MTSFRAEMSKIFNGHDLVSSNDDTPADCRHGTRN